MAKVQEKHIGMFITIAIMLVGVFSIVMFLSDSSSITGGVNYRGGQSCTISGKTYPSCVSVDLSPGEVAITHVPWMAKTFTGLADKIAKRSSGATPQIRAWTGLTNWINEKIYESTPELLRNLGRYIRTQDPQKGWVILQIGTNIKSIKDSWWPGWQWIELDYDFYYQQNNKRFKKYGSITKGFYYKPSTGEVKH